MRWALVTALAAAVVPAGLAQVPTHAGTPVAPATVLGGTGMLYTSDNCGAEPAPPGAGGWIFSLELTLTLRLNGRERSMHLASPWEYPANWPDYSGGDRSVPCGYRTLPVMSFAGTTTDQPSLTREPVHGFCWNDRGLLGADRLNCRLSIHGRKPFNLRMTLVDVYDARETEHSAGEDVNSTLVVSGAQHLAPSS